MSLPANRGSRNYYSYFEDNTAYLNHSGAATPIGLFVGGKYNASAPTYADGDPAVLQMTSEGRLKVDADISLTDIDVQIGAVELKDATTSTRAKIKTDGTDNALVVMQNALPTGSNTIGDVTVSSLPALATGTNTIGSVKVTDGTTVLPVAIEGATMKSSGIMLMGNDGTNARSIRLDSSGYLLPGTGASNLGKAEDAAHASSDVGVMALAVRNDTLAALATTDGDYAPLQVNATGALFSIEVPTTESTAAPTIARDTSVDETAAVAVKASAGNMYGYYFDNPNSYDVFVKWYNTASGSVTVGTTSVVRTTRVPAVGSVFVEANKPQQNFGTAISIACTKLIADSDTTAITTDIYAEVYYK